MPAYAIYSSVLVIVHNISYTAIEWHSLYWATLSRIGVYIVYCKNIPCTFYHMPMACHTVHRTGNTLYKKINI